MRVGLFGGSFDPVHRGHVLPIREVAARHRLDRVVYLPTAAPPHKDREMAPAQLRSTMVELALLDDDDLVVSSFELGAGRGPGGVSYTIDTVEHFKKLHPEWRLFLLLGEDSWQQIHQWNRSEDLSREAEVIVMPRPGSQPRAVESRAGWAAAVESGRVIFSQTRPVEASSTEIRRRIRSK